MRGRGLLTFGLISLSSIPVHAQSDDTYEAGFLWGNEDANVDFQAEGGIEALEEPDSVLDATAYVTINAAALVRLYNFQGVFNAPIRLNMNNSFALREQDWDEGRDFLRIFRCLRLDYMTLDGVESMTSEGGDCHSWTPEEAAGDVTNGRQDFLYLSTRMRPVYDYSLGYGSLVQGYNATLEENEYRDGLQLESNINRHFVINAALSDVADPTVVAGRVAFRPIETRETNWEGTDNDNFVEVAVTAASDLQPPTFVDDQLTNDSPFLAGGVDSRFRLSSHRWGDDYQVLRFELGTELNHLFGYGSGIHGHLRFYYDVGAFDFYIDSEYRAILGQYIPSYFNQHYNVQRSQYLLSREQRQTIGALNEQDLRLTKLDFLGRLPDQTAHAYAETMRFRFWREVSDGWLPSVDFWLFAEGVPERDQSARAGVGMTIHELFDRVNVDALFVQQGWDNLGGLFSLENSVLDIDASYRLADELYLQLYFDQAWFQAADGQFDTANDVGLGLGYER